MEEWRSFLYPLGFTAALPFTLRFILQWMISEAKGKSVVTRSFWLLSLLGNILLAAHSIVQIQYNIAMIQTANGVISWRNLNLLRTSRKRYTLAATIAIFCGALCSITILFLCQSCLLQGSDAFFRTPNFMYSRKSASWVWHFAGTFGMLLFTSRFWVQWWLAEKQKQSSLTAQFWFLSLIGALLSLIYFLKIGDPVNTIGPAVGIIPYARNLYLLKKTSRLKPVEQPQ